MWQDGKQDPHSWMGEEEGCEAQEETDVLHRKD